MNLIHKTKQRYLISFTREELGGINNTLNEVCNGIHIDEEEFSTRLGFTRLELATLLRQVRDSFGVQDTDDLELVEARADSHSVQVRAISAFGDPVDMSTDEALAFAALITSHAHAAGAT